MKRIRKRSPGRYKTDGVPETHEQAIAELSKLASGFTASDFSKAVGLSDSSAWGRRSLTRAKQNGILEMVSRGHREALWCAPEFTEALREQQRQHVKEMRRAERQRERERRKVTRKARKKLTHEEYAEKPFVQLVNQSAKIVKPKKAVASVWDLAV